MSNNPSTSQQYTAIHTGQSGEWERYRVVPSGVVSTLARNSVNTEYGDDTSSVFDGDEMGDSTGRSVMTGKDGRQKYTYIPFGADDQLPFEIMRRIGSNMVASQCQSFNILACYGQGVRFVDREDHADVSDPEILDFCLRNSLHETFLEQATDMKYFFFTVTVVILSRDARRIVQVRHKESCYCRFEKADASGRIGHVFYANWRNQSPDPEDVEVIPLLDVHDPLGDLRVRLGQEPDPLTGVRRKFVDAHAATRDRKFAILSRMPTPGLQYYPVPYYASMFRDSWFDIYRLIGIGKRFMIKNTSAPRVQIEVHYDYWNNVCDIENITDEAERVKRKEREKQNIVDFVTGPENAGKALVSGYYVDPNGKENRMVRIFNLSDGGKQGGDWSDDMSEASNALCFALGVHPNLVGATPGKSQMNNSGSDKRELFTLKQRLEKAFHDVMCKPYHVISHFNGWNDRVTVDVPIIELTTLDENKDSKVVTNSNLKQDDDNNN